MCVLGICAEYIKLKHLQVNQQFSGEFKTFYDSVSREAWKHVYVHMCVDICVCVCAYVYVCLQDYE